MDKLKRNVSSDIGISIVIPAFNESRSIIQTIESILDCIYPVFEVIIINDGSSDNTLFVLLDFFGPSIKLMTYNNGFILKSAPILSVFCINYKDILFFVIDKENGGKGDALNAGICLSHYDVVLCVDADTRLKKDSLLIMARYYEENDCSALGGRVAIDLAGSNRALDYLQCYEFDFAFNYIRRIINRLDCSFLISGAFGLFDKKLLVEIGGYSTDTLAEDMELIFRIRKYEIETGRKYPVKYTKKAICYTKTSKDHKNLFRQRTRWAKGLIEVLLKHRDIFLDSRYRYLHHAMILNFLINEMLQPYTVFFEIVVYIVLLYKQKIGLSILFFIISLLIKFVIDIMITHSKKQKVIIPLMMILSILQVGYYWFNSICKFTSPIYMRYKKRHKKNMWGIQERD